MRGRVVSCCLILGCAGCRADLEAADSTSGGGSGTTGMLEGGSDCDDGAFDYAFEIDATESCYAIQKSWVPWATAEAVCMGWGGHLAALTSVEEQSQVAAKMLPIASPLEAYEVWIGASSSDGTWTWSSGEPFEYMSWGPDQPNYEGAMACGTINDSTGFQWHDEACESTYRLLCER